MRYCRLKTGNLRPTDNLRTSLKFCQINWFSCRPQKKRKKIIFFLQFESILYPSKSKKKELALAFTYERIGTFQFSKKPNCNEVQIFTIELSSVKSNTKVSCVYCVYRAKNEKVTKVLEDHLSDIIVPEMSEKVLCEDLIVNHLRANYRTPISEMMFCSFNLQFTQTTAESLIDNFHSN